MTRAGRSGAHSRGVATVMLALLVIAPLSACKRSETNQAEDERTVSSAASVGASAKVAPTTPDPRATAVAPPSSADCAKYKGAENGADDILGLKVGMSLEEVRGRLACSPDSYAVTESERSMQSGPAYGAQLIVLEAKVPQPRPPVPDFSRSDLKVTFARTGQQTAVVQIDRWAYYEGSARPAVTRYRSEVEAKYAGISFEDVGTAYPLGVLALTVDGQRLSAANKLRRTCIGTGAWQHRMELSPLCGPAFAIQIYFERNDPNYVSSIQSTLSNPSFSAKTLAASRQAAEQEAQRKLGESITNGPKADL